MRRDPRTATSDEIRYGTAGDEVADALQAEVKADWADYMLRRTEAARALSNGEEEGASGDTLCSDAVAL